MSALRLGGFPSSLSPLVPTKCAPSRRNTFTWDTAQSARDFRPFLPSRPGQFHPGPLTEPYVSISIHTARAAARRLPAFQWIIGVLPLSIDPIQRR
jgi:hypothetical protein